MTFIKLTNISKRFGTTTVLDRISLDVPSGELVALLGQSGSGKSTLLKLIAGIEQPHSGDIVFDDASILPIAAHQRNAVLMFQAAYLFPFLSVEQNIAFGLKTRGIDKHTIKRNVAAMLELVELPDVGRRMPHQLSGGQQQRVALARALIVQPRVLMLDEPLSNLDPAIRATLQQVIRRIQRELKITTLLVTHDVAEAMALADRVAVLLDGRIAAYNTPSTIYERPPTRAAAQFVGINNFLHGRLNGDQFDCELGVLPVQATANTPRQATFAIRPERIVLHNNVSELHGTITRADYYGSFCEYDIAVQNTRLIVRESHQPLRNCGDQVGVFLPAEALFEVT